MLAGWVIYYAMVVAHVVGGGYAFVRGSTVHRLVLAVLLIGVVLQLIGCAALVCTRHLIALACVNFDFLLNLAMAIGLLALAMCYPKYNWIILIMLLQAGSLAVDALVFDDDVAKARLYFADIANLINIAEFSVLAFSAVKSRKLRAIALQT